MSADNCRAIDSLAPASSPFGLPVYVVGRQSAPFRETPIRHRRRTKLTYNQSAVTFAQSM
jgi:hypothetical protein